jgi:plasmid maintenance system killer protein
MEKGFVNLSLGLIYHSKALPQPPSRDTIPLRLQMFSDNAAKKDLSKLLATLYRHFGVQPFFSWSIGVNDQV